LRLTQSILLLIICFFFLDPTLYHTIIRSLVYLIITRPNITYVIHVVSQFVTSPTIVHWATTICILRYFQSTVFQSFLFTSTFFLELRDYSDVDHDSNLTNRKSVTGFYVFLSDSLISWKSKKQSIVSQSSTEAEYRAMTSTTKKIVWLRWLLADMRVSLSHLTLMYCDNQSSIQIAHNLFFHEWTKHIKIDCHLIRRHFKHGTITSPSVPSSLQIADFFTKSHSFSCFCFLVGKPSMLMAAALWVWGDILRDIRLFCFIV
jgi:hypothetical protein